MQPKFLLFALSAPLLGVQTAAAQDTHEANLYADLGYSRIGSDLLELNNLEPSLEFGGLSGHVGYRFSKHWSVEAEAVTGVENDKQIYRSLVPDIDGTNAITTSVTTDLSHLVGVFAKGTIPVTQKFDAFARVGIANTDFDYSSRSTITNLDTEETSTSMLSGSHNESGIAVGIGLSYDISNKIYLRGEYTQYDVTDIELDNVSVSVGLRF